MEIAGFTQLTGSSQQPDRLNQRDTLVRTEHRGHRLGLALKVSQPSRSAEQPGAAGNDPYLERRVQRPDDRGERPARLPPGRAPARLAGLGPVVNRSLLAHGRPRVRGWNSSPWTATILTSSSVS